MAEIVRPIVQLVTLPLAGDLRDPFGGAAGSPASANTLIAQAGSFLLSADAMTALADYRIPSAVGAFALTGQAATLSTTSTGLRQFSVVQSYLNAGSTRSFASYDQYVT